MSCFRKTAKNRASGFKNGQGSFSFRENYKRYANFSQPAKKLPDSGLEKTYGLFPIGTPNGAVTYDSIVYDTYDYMDQVISFSLSDTLIAAFEIYGEKTGDQRASNIIDLLRYNTNNKTHILLLRYGFTPEVIKEIGPHIETIDENKITFLPTIKNTPDFVRKIVNWYIPE